MIASVREDVNAYVAVEGENLDRLDLSAFDRTAFASLLKITHVNDVHGVALRVPSARENAIDIDCAQHILIQADVGSDDSVGDQVVTVKGGSRNVYMDLIVRGPAGRQNSHIQVGNWMDQSYKITADVRIRAKHKDGGPVNVVTGWVVPFSVHLPGDCRWLFVESMKLKAYVLAKFLVRFALRIPKGVKGPAWM